MCKICDRLCEFPWVEGSSVQLLGVTATDTVIRLWCNVL